MYSPTNETYNDMERAYAFFNEELFDGSLPACLFTYQRNKRSMGYVSQDRWVNINGDLTAELAMNPEYFKGYDLIEYCATLNHELCHVWQCVYGKPGRRGYHNQEWAEKMESIGLMPSTTGKPGGKKVGEKMSDYVLADGAFLNACKKLIDSGFRLSWVDRYPVKRIPGSFFVYTKSGEEIPHSSGPSEDESLIEGSEEQIDYVEEPEQNRSNRLKYQCINELCDVKGTSVWGKPNLNILCGECNEAFSVV